MPHVDVIDMPDDVNDIRATIYFTTTRHAPPHFGTNNRHTAQTT